MQDLSTIDERMARFEATPIYKEGLFLAGYYSKIGEYLRSVDYYRRSVALGRAGSMDYAYQIFYNMANAVWNDMISFDSLFPAADAALRTNSNELGIEFKVAQLITRVARKVSRTGEIARYLQIGIDATGKIGGEQAKQDNALLKADYTLYIEKDLVKATQIKKASLGSGWENDRDKFYEYAKWCLEREINLEEAEMYARKAINLVYPGKYRARVLGTVADICFARGNKDEAIRVINQAIAEDPDDLLYQNQLKRFRGEGE